MQHDEQSHFASPERSGRRQLESELEAVTRNQVLEGILRNTSSMLAILDENRQILTVNHTLLKMLGIDTPHKVLGLRPGEAIHCVHAHDMTAGCGTSKFCSTCGAAIAIVSSLTNDKSEERTCVAEVQRDGKISDLYLRVRATPVEYKGHRFILLFLQDISPLQKKALLERVFFHDINNIATALLSGAEMLNIYKLGDRAKEIAEDVFEAASQLTREIAIQKQLLGDEPIEIGVNNTLVTAQEIAEDLKSIFRNHPAARDKKLESNLPRKKISFYTDRAFCVRVLSNMILNAFEASDRGDTVKLTVKAADRDLYFNVWNRTPIPDDVALRIFQLNFSTKDEIGRGLGTYSMKLFAEHYLDGEVSFTSSKEDGTTFTLKLPC